MVEEETREKIEEIVNNEEPIQEEVKQEEVLAVAAPCQEEAIEKEVKPKPKANSKDKPKVKITKQPVEPAPAPAQIEEESIVEEPTSASQAPVKVDKLKQIVKCPDCNLEMTQHTLKYIHKRRGFCKAEAPKKT